MVAQPLLVDGNLIGYPAQERIAPDIDAVRPGRHDRRDIMNTAPPASGDLLWKGPLYAGRRIERFRLDASERGVTSVMGGIRGVVAMRAALGHRRDGAP